MRTRHFSQLPKAYTAYPKVITDLIPNKKKKKSKSITLPEVDYIVDALNIDVAHLQKYTEICGFKHDGTVPATYFSVLAQSLQMHMMTQENFPFALLGLVHIRNTVKQYRVLKCNETYRLSCQFGELTAHDKGVQFDFIITAKVADDVVFEGLTTYLHRQKSTTTLKKNPVPEKKSPAPYLLTESWTLSENLGRRYAAISGDFNLIHLHKFTAKAFGFKHAIAHGLWTKARSLAGLSPLPDAYEADVQFKLPIYIPSAVELKSAQQESEIDFTVVNERSQKPHLVGTLKTLSSR